MKHFSAQYIITNTGTILKRAVVTTGDDGTILKIDEKVGSLRESRAVNFYNGIIIPGFVNCHAHLELSHLKGAIPEGKGLVDFLIAIRTGRSYNYDEILSSALTAEDELYKEGINLCADICNTASTFGFKKTSRISYINLIEVFGIDPGKAEKRIDEINEVCIAAEEAGLQNFLVPHSAYSVSLPLFSLLKRKTSDNKVTSIHFLESEEEKRFFSDYQNLLAKSYKQSGLLQSTLQIPGDHVEVILHEMNRSGNLILVHNTFADKETVRQVISRGNTFWCLCPGSNLYIEKQVPPLEMLIDEGCDIVIGTDSLASNNKLSILSELKILQKHFPSLSLEDLIRWATINGAKALCYDNNYGKIEPGMKPGLLLLENVDLVNFKLLSETTVSRLV